MPKEPYKERAKRHREEEILAIAERLLIERGYANLNMDDLAEAVGISKPTLYQHFKGKEELAARVFIRGFKETEDFLAQPLEQPAIDRIVELIRWSTNKRYAAGNSIAGIRPDVIWNMMKGNPEAEGARARIYTHLVALVEKAKEEGSITREVPTPIVTHGILSIQWALHSPMMQAEIANNPAGLSGLIDSLIYLFLHGVTPAGTATSNN